MVGGGLFIAYIWRMVGGGLFIAYFINILESLFFFNGAWHLLPKKDALKNDELLKAIADSPRSFEDILQYIKGEGAAEATEAAKGTSEPTTSE